MNNFVKELFIGSAAGMGAMTVYGPWHYWQNRHIQDLEVVRRPNFWFRGVPSLAIGKVPTYAVHFSVYSLLMDINPTFASVVAGSSAGVVNNFTHLVTLHQENTGQSFFQVVKKHGIKQCVSRGLGTVIFREITFNVIFMNVLIDIKNRLMDKTTMPKWMITLSSAVLTGCGVVLVTQPHMVVSALLYADMDKKKYNNGYNVIIDIWKQKGLRAFYKGAARRTPGVILGLMVLHQISVGLRTFMN
jgi:Mitochondrial carrier protein